MPTAATVTIPGVQLLKVGRWYSKSHPDGRDYTAAELAAAVAAYNDPTVDHPVLKIGHRSKLAEAHLGDGAPALGWVANLRLDDNGTTLVGDLVDVPAKLAAIIPKAFRRRSAELAFGVRAASGKAYAMVLNALSLLGEQPPAVKGLDDVAGLYGLSGNEQDADELVELDLAAGVDPLKAAELAAAVDQVDELGLSPAVRAAAVAELEAAAGVKVPTIPAPQPAPRQTGAQPATDPIEEPGTMTIDEADLRTKLGLAADGDVDAAITKLLEDAKNGAEGEKPGDKPGEEKPAEGEKPGEKAPEPVGAALSAETVKALEAAGVAVISKDVLAELTTGAKAGAEVAAQLAASGREAKVDAAIRGGKLAPAERDHWLKVLTEAPETGEALLAAMAPRFAVAEVGADVDTAELGALSGAAGDAALASFLTDAGVDFVGLDGK